MKEGLGGGRKFTAAQHENLSRPIISINRTSHLLSDYKILFLQRAQFGIIMRFLKHDIAYLPP